MSFLRHLEIYPSDGGASRKAGAPTHRLDEFPTGYSLAGWSPPELASASPAGSQYAVQSSCRSRDFQRTANSVLTVCVSPGGKPKYSLGYLSDQPVTIPEFRKIQLAVTGKGLLVQARDRYWVRR
jgi:hypothetical protein